MQAGSPENPYTLCYSVSSEVGRVRGPGFLTRPEQPGKELERGQPRVSLSPGYESSKLAPISRGVMVSIWKAMPIHSTLIKKRKQA